MEYQANMIEETENTWYAVITELDGHDPGSAFYRWRDQLVGNIRGKGSKALGPLERRAHGQKEHQADRGIIVQESVIFAKSKSLAETIAGIIYWVVGERILERAEQDGDPNARRPLVLVTKVDMTQANMPPADYQALERTRAVLGARGRKPEAREYAVACHECRRVTNDEQPKGRVLQCPNCGGLKIAFREGRAFAFADDPEMDIVDVWRRSRFAAGHWEPSDLAAGEEGKALPKQDPEIVGTREHDVAAAVDNSDDFLGAIRRIAADEKSGGREQALVLLDAAFLARAHNSKAENQDARIEAATRFFANDGDPNEITLAARPDQVDMLDTALILGANRAVGYLLELLEGDDE